MNRYMRSTSMNCELASKLSQNLSHQPLNEPGCLMKSAPLTHLRHEKRKFIHFIYTSYTLHIHFIYTSYTLHIHFIYTSYTLHIHFIYTWYTLHLHLIYTSFTLHTKVNSFSIRGFPSLPWLLSSVHHGIAAGHNSPWPLHYGTTCTAAAGRPWRAHGARERMRGLGWRWAVHATISGMVLHLYVYINVYIYIICIYIYDTYIYVIYIYIYTHRIHVCYIYGNIYHQYTPNVSIYTIHGSYGIYMYNYKHINQLM